MATNPLRAAWGYLRGDDLPRMAGVDLKAATLTAPQTRRRGFYQGDPVSGGVWVDLDASSGWWRGNGAFDYRRAVGDGLDNSMVAACLRAICEAVQEPLVRLYRPDAEGELQKQDEKADVVRLLRKPNPYMRWRHLVKNIALCEHWTGNAYLWKARSGAGRPVELWPLSPTQVEPVAGESTREWIRHYAYRPDEQHEAIELPVEDVLHFKLDVDPRNPRKGASPLRPLLAHLFGDQEATEFQNAFLRNFGVPGVVLTPDVQAAASGGPPLNEAATERIKQTYKQKFSGSQRGEPMVMHAPWKVNVVSFNPQQMLMDKLQRLPESRVCAVMGVPPIVALLYVGLENATYSNAEQFQSAFVENKMVPYWSLLDEELTDALIPEFYGEDSDYVLRHDLSDVRALSEDEDQKGKRLEGLVGRGVLTINDVRREMGFPEFDGEDGDVLLIPNTVTATAPADLLAEPEPPPAPPQAQIAEVPPQQGQQGQLPPPAPGSAPAATRSMKAAADVVPRLLRLRSRLTKEAERDLTRFLSRQARRTVSRLGPLPVTPVTPTKAVRELAGHSLDVLLPADLEAKALSDVLTVYYLRALQGAQQVTEDALGIAFELDDPVTRRYLDEAGGEIAGITDTTRQAVRDALSEGQRVGESVAQLAKRLEALPAFGAARAAVIARTELASATNRAATVSYRASGVVVGVEIFDQESDAECVGWNGRRLTLDEAERTPLLVHVNCTQARAPIVDAASLG